MKISPRSGVLIRNCGQSTEPLRLTLGQVRLRSRWPSLPAGADNIGLPRENKCRVPGSQLRRHQRWPGVRTAVHRATGLPCAPHLRERRWPLGDRQAGWTAAPTPWLQTRPRSELGAGLGRGSPSGVDCACARCRGRSSPAGCAGEMGTDS